MKAETALDAMMTELVNVREFKPGDREQGRWCAEQLERGNILFFAETPFDFPAPEREFLLGQRQSGAAYHKNVAYRPSQDRLTGSGKCAPEEEERLRAALRAYSERAVRFLSQLLPQYAAAWKIDFASFRPQEEEGRQIRLHARNDLLHVDSFPTRPTNGDRILRFFTNINPSKPRVWLTGETFEGLAQGIWGSAAARGPAVEAGAGAEADRAQAEAEARDSLAGAGALLPRPADSALGLVRRSLVRAARAAGLPVANPSPYDEFMHRFHNYMKQASEYQQTCPKSRWEFPPNSSWIVFTDMVSHAVLSGQYALEQTFMVARDSLVLPDRAPVAILERVAGRALTLSR